MPWSIALSLLILVGCGQRDESTRNSAHQEKQDYRRTTLESSQLFRGTNIIGLELRRADNLVSRNLYLGDMILAESDEDHNGSLERVVLYDTQLKRLEGFVRSPDGSVRVFSNREIQTGS